MELKLNLNKCKFISYTRRKSRKIDFSYNIDNVILDPQIQINDLGVILSSDFCFKTHIDKLTKKCFKLLGFLKRSCRHFSPPTLRLLYLHIVRSLLEYCSPVWSPHQQYLSDFIERDQKNFIRYLCFISAVLTLITHISNTVFTSTFPLFFNLPTLHHRRIQSDIRTLHRITHHAISCPTLTSSLQFHVPRLGSRHPQVYHLPTARTNLRKFSPLPRMMSTYNNLLKSTPELDIFKTNYPHIHFRNQ